MIPNRWYLSGLSCLLWSLTLSFSCEWQDFLFMGHEYTVQMDYYLKFCSNGIFYLCLCSWITSRSHHLPVLRRAAFHRVCECSHSRSIGGTVEVCSSPSVHIWGLLHREFLSVLPTFPPTVHSPISLYSASGCWVSLPWWYFRLGWDRTQYNFDLHFLGVKNEHIRRLFVPFLFVFSYAFQFFYFYIIMKNTTEIWMGISLNL